MFTALHISTLLTRLFITRPPESPAPSATPIVMMDVEADTTKIEASAEEIKSLRTQDAIDCLLRAQALIASVESSAEDTSIEQDIIRATEKLFALRWNLRLATDARADRHIRDFAHVGGAR